MSAPLAWQPVDLHTAPSGRSCTIHDPRTLSAPLNTQRLLSAPAHWVKLHGHRDQSCAYQENTTDRNTCKLLCGSECLCTFPARRADRDPRDVTAHCTGAVYVCRYTHACTNHLTRRLSTHPTRSHEHPCAGIQGPADAGQAGVNGREAGKEIKSKKKS